MPSVEENIQAWNDQHKWSHEGDEWSDAWGGVSSQWFGTILPRIRSFVPVPTILEIAPGHGRWTQFLRSLCSHLILVDVSEKCIDACRRRFTDCGELEYYVNDGKSLDMVVDRSVDLAFSFDSLVHVEAEVLLAYLAELGRKLAPQGVAFLHHSNLGEYTDPATGLIEAGLQNAGWRAASVSARLVRRACVDVGLTCVSQEIINWGAARELTDAFTVIARPDSRWAGECIVLRNADFAAETGYVANLARLYDWGRLARGRVR